MKELIIFDSKTNEEIHTIRYSNKIVLKSYIKKFLSEYAEIITLIENKITYSELFYYQIEKVN